MAGRLGRAGHAAVRAAPEIVAKGTAMEAAAVVGTVGRVLEVRCPAVVAEFVAAETMEVVATGTMRQVGWVGGSHPTLAHPTPPCLP